MAAYGHNSRAFDDWYSEQHESETPEFPSTFDLIRSGMLVSDDAADIQLWQSLHGTVVPMTLSSEEWGDVAR